MIRRVTEQKVQAQYDGLAAVYDVRWDSYISGTLATLPDCLSLMGNESILDVASGTGEVERLFMIWGSQSATAVKETAGPLE